MSQVATSPTEVTMPDTGLFAGFGVIFRKEIREWNATHRTLLATVLSTLLCLAGPVGFWIYKGGLHSGKIALTENQYAAIVSSPSLVMGTLGYFMVIGMTMGMIVREEDLGTLQWVFTKPLSRSGLVLAKWLANSVMTIVTIIAIPALISYGVIDLLYGIDDTQDILLGLVGIAILYVFQCALSCGVSAIFSSSSAVAGLSFALFFLPTLVASLIGDWARLIPSQISNVASNVAQGERLEGWDYATIASTVIFTALLMLYAVRKLTVRDYR